MKLHTSSAQKDAAASRWLSGAIREGRQCARAIDQLLMGASLLPR
ncbi:MAG: hypothetical protein ACREE2_08125 [Stellaceae bacterium]